MGGSWGHVTPVPGRETVDLLAWERREGWPWYRPLGILIVTVLVLIVGGLVAPVFPLLIVFGIGRWLYFVTGRYHRQPSDVSIAVIGAGWSGLQIMARLKELGVTKLQGFEANDDVGGTWHPSRSYHNLSCHAAMWSAAFKDFPYSSVKKEQDRRIEAANVQQYLKDYVDHTGVRSSYRFNACVQRMSYDSAQRTATLRIEGDEADSGPFDLVIFASLACSPEKPEIDGAADFQGDNLHTINLSSEKFSQLVKDGKRVAIVGGSKSACDNVYNMHAAGVSSLTWIFRRPYAFFRYEKFFHNRRPFGMFIGFLALAAWLVSILLPPVGWLMECALGYTWSYHGRGYLSWRTFHFGMLDAHQRHVLSKEVKQVVGNPVAFTPKGLRLEHGRSGRLGTRLGSEIGKTFSFSGKTGKTFSEIECDVVVWATGYKTGIEEIEYMKDGEPFQMPLERPLYQHFFVPRFPVMAVSAQLFTTSGPMRAMNSADLAVYGLCVRRKVSERYMECSARCNLCRQQMAGFILFQPNFWQNLVLLQVDLILGGIVPWISVLDQYIGIAVLGRSKPVFMNLLPMSLKQRAVECLRDFRAGIAWWMPCGIQALRCPMRWRRKKSATSSAVEHPEPQTHGKIEEPQAFQSPDQPQTSV